jgi:hypothetical protein
MNDCGCGTRAVEFGIFREYKEAVLFHKRAVLGQLLAERNNKWVLCFGRWSLRGYRCRIFEDDEPTFRPPTPSNGTLVLALKFLWRGRVFPGDSGRSQHCHCQH